MTNKPTKTAVPGEDDTVTTTMPDGREVRPAVVVPTGLSHEQLEAQVAAFKSALDSLQGQMSALVSQGKGPGTDNLPAPVTLEEANAKIKAQIDNGEVPTPILTIGGWLVHHLSHSSAEKVEEATDKAAKRAALKKG